MVNARFDAAATSCVVAGAMLWVSLVDCKTFTSLAKANKADTIKDVFGIWWPAGKAFMVPALAISVASQLWAFAERKTKNYLLSAISLVSIGLYTGAVLKEDIARLRSSSNTDTCATVMSFCKLHHPRTGFALIAAFSSLYPLSPWSSSGK